MPKENEEKSVVKPSSLHENLAKLLLMADDPSVHFVDLIKPDEKTQDRLNHRVADLLAIEEGLGSNDINVGMENMKKFDQMSERCRAVVMDLNPLKEAAYALEMNPKKLTRSAYWNAIQIPENSEKLSTLFGEISKCIQKADKTKILSEMIVDGKKEPVPQVLNMAGKTKAMSLSYKDKANFWRERQNAHAKKEKEAESEPSSKKESIKDLESDERFYGGNLHVVKAPQLDSVSRLETWERIMNWLSEQLGFGPLYSEESKQKQTTEKAVQKEDTKWEFEQEQPKQTRKQESRSMRAPVQEQPVAAAKVSAAEDYNRTIRALQMENLRKDSIIKYLQAELLKAQLREQNLKNEKLQRELDVDKAKDVVKAMKDSATQQKEVQHKEEQQKAVEQPKKAKEEQKKEEKKAEGEEVESSAERLKRLFAKGREARAKRMKEAQAKEEKKAAVEKISFKQLSKEEADVEKKHPKLEALKENEKKRIKDDSMIVNRKSLERGGKKAPGMGM